MFGDLFQQFKIPGQDLGSPPVQPQPAAGAPGALPAAQPTDQVGIASPEAPAAGIAPPTPQAGPLASPLAPRSPLGGM